MYLLSFVSLCVAMFWCVVGIFSPKAVFDDNLAERLGMVGVFAFCLARFVRLYEAGEMTSHLIPATVQVIGHAGLALYFTGAATAKLKAWRNRSEPPIPPLPEIQEQHLRKAHGGHK